MAKYPTSYQQGTVADVFKNIFTFHVQEGSSVLDPTCGECLSWERVDIFDYDITFSDIKKPYEQDLFDLLEDYPEYKNHFDAIYYDPPYFIDVVKSNDARQDGYAGTEQDLKKYMDAINYPLNSMLKPNGKLILKCSDQYIVKTREFKLWHYDWIDYLKGAMLEPVDFFVYHYNHVSPTAYQVKDRPASVISHTYYIVAQKTN